MDRARFFHELSLDQMVEIGSRCQAGEVVLDDFERLELARAIVQRRTVVSLLEELVTLHYPPGSYPP